MFLKLHLCCAGTF